MTQAVATPIEQELNGTPGMIYMESSSSNSGGFSATVTFDISTDPDLAAVDIQNRLKKAEARLPAEVVQNGISVEKQAASKLMTITLLSSDPKFDEIYLSNYATLNVLDMLRRVPGVGSVSNVGSRYYAMQIWVMPDKLADLGLTVKDLQNALKDQNRESAAGVLGQAPMNGIDVTIPITAQGRLSSVSEFEDIVVRANPDGSIIRLKDVARISLEASSYNTESGINGGNAAVLNINMLPGANAMEVAALVKAAMEEISHNFPEGIGYEIPFDMTTYISESIHHVYQTLFEALLLVILVVFLSLQSWRATIIPIVAVPISLIGTFGVMLVFGFSLNMLTLLGLILAIGIVVDDAIVVVENVDRIMNEEHLSPYEATKKAMSNLSGALIAMSLVLCAVFVPVSFLSGITGQLYRQFTITIAVSVLISTLFFIFLLMLCMKKRLSYVVDLRDDLRLLEAGDLDHEVTVSGNDELSQIGEGINNLRRNVLHKIQTERDAITANHELITAMSHDLRTPLTKQIGYLEILYRRKFTQEEELFDYIQKARSNAFIMKDTTDKLFRYFLAFGGQQQEAQQSEVDGKALLNSVLKEQIAYINSQGFVVSFSPITEAFRMLINPEEFARIFDNIFHNLRKYGDNTVPVNISYTLQPGELLLMVQNGIRQDTSKVESTKIGLKIVEKIMKSMGGSVEVMNDGQYFIIQLVFKIEYA